MNKTTFFAILAISALIASTNTAALDGIEIITIGPSTNLIGGETYKFTVAYVCGSDDIDAEPLITGVRLTYIDGASSAVTNCPDCNCSHACACVATQAIAALTAAQETKEIHFVLDAGGYSVVYDPITVYAPAAEAVFASDCGELMSGVKAVGQHCWEYSEGPYDTSPNAWDDNKFECTAPVSPTPGFQVNVGKPCVVNCKESKTIKACKCYPVTACIDKCVEGSFIPFCTEVPSFECSTSPEYDCATASTKPFVRCDNTKTCKAACAQGCGRETTFGTRCDENCNTITCNKATYTKNEKDNCMSACVSMCKANQEMCNLMMILDILAALIAAIMLAINGLNWIMSEDPESRAAARGGVNYVIVGVIVVLVGLALVSAILGVSIICYI